MSDKLSDEQIEAAKAAGFSWHPIWQCLVVRHSNGAWSEVSDKLARFAALLAASPAPAISESEDAVKLERSIEQWRKCDPELMSRQSPAAIFYALKDAKHDILALDAARKGEKS